MSLFQVRATGSYNGELLECYYIVNAINEDDAENVFTKIQPRVDPEFSVKSVEVELLTEDDVLILNEDLFS